MHHRLTNYDYAVLAAARIGALKRENRAWSMAGVNCMASLFRLEQAGEVYIALDNSILFPGTERYNRAVELEDFTATIKRGVRNGTIKVVPMKPTKGKKP